MEYDVGGGRKMKRIIWMVFRCLFYVPYWFYMLKKLGSDDRYDEETRYRFLRKVTVHVNRVGRVMIVSDGQENLPEKSGYIMFPNHQGLYDALAFLESHERPFTIVAKQEVKDVFLLKQVLQLLKAQFLDRDDIRQGLKVIKQMTEEVMQGRNYIIFAEGTRSRKGNEILEFKGGSFKSAMNAKCPIVPVALVDSFVPFDQNSIKKTKVQVHYLNPIYYEEYQGMKSKEIAKMVEEQIKETIKHNQNLYSA